MIAARLGDGGAIHFDVEDVEISGIDSDALRRSASARTGRPSELDL